METITSTHAEHVIGTPLGVSTVESVDNSFMLPDIDKRILKIRPMATPIDQISRSAAGRRSSSMEVRYYAVDTRPSKAAVSSIVSNDDGSYTINFVDHNAGKSFSKTDTVLIAGGLAGGKAPMFYVSDIEGRRITVNYIGPDSTFTPAEAGDAETVAIRMGRAASEFDVQTPQTTFIPKSYSNFCQIFKAQVEQGALFSSGLKSADMSFTDQQEAAIIDMRMGMERNFLFGAQKKLVTSDGNTYFTEGIWTQAGKEFALPSNIDNGTFLDMCREAFTGNGASSRKVLVAGTGCVKRLVAGSNTMKTIGSVETEIHWGLSLKVISTNFGTLYVVHSETFDLCGHSDDGIIIDPEYLQKYSHIPFSAMVLDLKKSGQRNTDAVVLTEASCLVLRYPEAHMRIVTRDK
jgi:hypothetical protein